MTKPKTYLIGAVSYKGIYGIGRGDKGKIPWKSKLDMSFFVKQTTGDGSNDVAMSRGMWSALPQKYRPLPGRGNIIVSSQKDIDLTEEEKKSGVRVVLSPLQAKQISTAKELYFAGGQDIWYNSRHEVDELLINVLYLKVPEKSESGEALELVMFPHLLNPTKLWPEFTIVSSMVCHEEDFTIQFHRYVRK